MRSPGAPPCAPGIRTSGPRFRGFTKPPRPKSPYAGVESGPPLYYLVHVVAKTVKTVVILLRTDGVQLARYRVPWVPRMGAVFCSSIPPKAVFFHLVKTPPAPPGIMYPRFFAFPSFFGVHSSLGAGFFFCCLCARLVLRRGMRVASMDALLLQWGSAA